MEWWSSGIRDKGFVWLWWNCVILFHFLGLHFLSRLPYFLINSELDTFSKQKSRPIPFFSSTCVIWIFVFCLIRTTVILERLLYNLCDHIYLLHNSKNETVSKYDIYFYVNCVVWRGYPLFNFYLMYNDDVLKNHYDLILWLMTFKHILFLVILYLLVKILWKPIPLLPLPSGIISWSLF